MEKKTPLYERHVACGGRMVPFAGYLLPVQYSGVVPEHRAVRSAAGLFDVSHMGEFLVTGKSALAALNGMLSNDFSNMAVGKVRYSLLCNHEGGIVDDLVVYKLAEERYLLVVNAANREKDFAWMARHLPEGALIEDVSERWALLALQGPAATAILEKLAREEDIPTGYYTFREGVQVAGVRCLVSRMGYTGEEGYELYCAPADAETLWDALLSAGGEDILPCGLGARDTLRLEASMPLYGHELTEETTPFEAELGFAVKMDKGDFIGREALLASGEPQKVRVGIAVTGRGIVREHCALFADGRQVGETTSGTHLPWLDGAYAMGYLESGLAAPDTPLQVEVRGRMLDAEVVALPFYKRDKNAAVSRAKIKEDAV